MSFGSSISTDRPRGFTLIELLVGMTLTLILVGLLYQFLVPALKISNRVTLRADVQQQATFALRQIVSEMEEAGISGISLAADSKLLAIHPIEEVTQNSQRVYADQLTVYRFDQSAAHIVRAFWKSGIDPAKDSPRKFSPQELMSTPLTLIEPSRIIAKEVEDFSVTHSGSGNLLRLPFIVKLKLREPDQSGARSFELVRTVSLRNQL